MKTFSFILVLFLLNSSILAHGDSEPFLGRKFEGKASYYGVRFHGRTTANGEKMDKNAMTCAHKDLPFGTMVEVKYPLKGTKVIVRVNDRGPYSGNRVIDLSLKAAEELGMIQEGVGVIEATIVGKNGQVMVNSTNTSTAVIKTTFSEGIAESLK
jgi:rare lipoprotein A